MPVTNPYTIPYSCPTNFNISTEAQGDSIPAYTFQTQNNLVPKQTTFIGRVNNPPTAATALLTAGIPGTNYVGTTNVAPTFYQGEDIIFDAFLYIDGCSIDLNRYVLNGIIKSTVYLFTSNWTAVVGNGIYPDPSIPNHYVIFIPHTVTSCLIAGNFELDIYAVENVTAAQDIKPRTLVVGSTTYNFEYAAFSPDPESLQFNGEYKRALLPNSFPPVYNQTTAGLNNYGGSFVQVPGTVCNP